jgi:16S rRNA (adenine1518-N6/adenine1519-N6)-dimethyltransferase
LLRLLDPKLGLSRIVATVQREIADRLSARPGTRAYGRLAIAAQFRAGVHIAARVPPGAFFPQPEVESAVVVLVPHPGPPVLVPDEEEFFRLVAAAFSQRRKMLVNALSHGLGLESCIVEAACSTAGADPRSRAERVDLQTFAALARSLHSWLQAQAGRGT